MNKLCYISIIEYYSTLKMNKTTDTCNSRDESHTQGETGHKEYIPYDSIYMKF